MESIAVYDVAKDSQDPCIKCGARVAEWDSLGGPMESTLTHKRCRRCRHDQTGTPSNSR